MAEIRKQALLASGVQIEGLQQGAGSSASAPKKVVYGNRKKKGPATKDASPTPESRPKTPEVAGRSPASMAPESAAADKDDWDASSGDEEKKVTEVVATEVPADDVKDSWDASSDEEPAKTAPAAEKSVPSSSSKPTPKGTELEPWSSGILT